jgi:hypothetical protein
MSVESLNVFCKCGFNPNARQIRCTVGTETLLATLMPAHANGALSGSVLRTLSTII